MFRFPKLMKRSLRPYSFRHKLNASNNNFKGCIIDAMLISANEFLWREIRCDEHPLVFALGVVAHDELGRNVLHAQTGIGNRFGKRWRLAEIDAERRNRFGCANVLGKRNPILAGSLARAITTTLFCFFFLFKGGVGGISLSSLFSFCVGTQLAAVGVQLALLFIGQRENAALRNISAMDSHPSFSAKASKWAIWASVRRMPI